jgi:predicted dehydrogenase
MNDLSPLRVAVVGLAGIGKTHVRLLSEWPGVRLAGVCDVAPGALGLVEEETPKFTDYERLLDEARPHAVILATPPRSHLPLARGAAERGIHVFAEKPMAESVKSAEGMIRACREAGVVLMIGHKKRFVPALARLKALLEGDLGPAQFLIYRYAHPGRSEKGWFWEEEDGGGPLRENVVHAADLLRWLCGEVARVQGEADYFTFEERAPQPNCAVMTLRFASGAIASLSAGMVGTPALPDEDLYVATARGIAEVSGRFDNPGALRWAFRGEGEVRTETFDADPFRRELEHFLACVRTGETPLTSGEEGLRSLALCEQWKRDLRKPG